VTYESTHDIGVVFFLTDAVVILVEIKGESVLFKQIRHRIVV
jgi:hypothetical protein